MTSNAEIQRQIKEVKEKLEMEWQALDEVYRRIKTKHDEINETKQRRDEHNQLVKALISEGKEKQKERDIISKTIKPKREVIKNLLLNIKEYAKQISELKNIRDGKHREAKGSLEGLKDNVAASLTTLLTLDLSLKDEITLFDMIFSSKERFSAKVQAESTHEQIQEIYKALKESERQIMDIEAKIRIIIKESQERHNESVTKFKEKDEARNKSNELHQQVMNGYQEMRDLKGQIDDIKKNVLELKAELNVLYKKLRASAKKRQDMQQQEKLDDAKEKLKGEKKMGLDDLRLLIESGSLKK